MLRKVWGLMSDDWELERIRLKKMRELLGAGRKEEGVVIAKPIRLPTQTSMRWSLGIL